MSCSTKKDGISITLVDPPEYAELFRIEGEKKIFIDSLMFEGEKLNFSLDNSNFGVYRLKFDNKNWIDFVHDGKYVDLHSDIQDVKENIKIHHSKSNELFYKFKTLNKQFKLKTELLSFILARYPKDDEYYSLTQKRFDEIQREYLTFIEESSNTEPNSFISRYIKTSQLPVISKEISVDDQLRYFKSRALENVLFDDASLIYSDAFTNKTIEYLNYYRNRQLPKELLEKEFMKAVDTLLNKAKVNQLVYQHITEYLIDGFNQYGFDKIIDYIIENYVIEDDLCHDVESDNSIQKRIDQSKLLAIGLKVPNIIMPNIDGEVIDLYTIQSDRTLLVFYSSQCPHCKTLLPQLNAFQKQHNDLKILAISLDYKQNDWVEFVKDNQLNLININDPNGWDGHLASEFYIYATPTMFLLDTKKNIIGKPINLSELISYIQ